MHDGVEDRLSIAERRGRRLLLQRFGQFARARLHRVEQPHVLDGDHRLVGKGLDQFDLLLRERPHGSAMHGEQADGESFSQQRHHEDCAKASQPRGFMHGVFGVGKNIGNLNRLSLQHNAPDGSAAPGRPGLRPHVFKVLRGVTVARGGIVASVSGRTQNLGLIRLAQLRCRYDQCVEYCRQVESRAANHLEHVGGGGLLLQRFAQLAEQPRIFDGDNGLCGEVRYQRDLLVRERPDFLVEDSDGTDQLIIFEHRYGQHRPISGEVDSSADKRMALDVGRYGLDVGDLDDLFRDGDATQRCIRRRSQQRFARACLDVGGRSIVAGGHAEALRLAKVQIAELGPAEANRVRQHRLKDRLKLSGRARNDAQHL